MSLSTLYLWSKKIHRWSLSVIILLTMIMAGTGSLLKYPGLGSSFNVDMGLTRYIHREISTFFTIAMVVMICTGLVMYVIPEINKLRQNNHQPPTV